MNFIKGISQVQLMYFIIYKMYVFAFSIYVRERKRGREKSHTGVYIIVFYFIKDDADLTSYESCNEDDQEIETKLNIKLPKYAKQLISELNLSFIWQIFKKIEFIES